MRWVSRRGGAWPTTLAGELGQAGYQTQAIGKMHYYPDRHRIGFDDVLLHNGYLHAARGRERGVEFYDDYLVWLREQAGQSAVADYFDNGLDCNSVVARPWDKPEALHPTNWVVTEGIRWLYPEHVRGRAMAGYYGHVTHIDHQINRFLGVLAEFGPAANTYVCFVSDHGEMLGDHHMWRKGYPYEGSSRIPFLLNGPGIPAGGVRDDLTELRDVMPTLLDCAGVPVPDGPDGRNVLPLVTTQPSGGWREHLHGEHTILEESQQWIVCRDEKYIWHSESGREQLFDLSTDPRELKDLAGDPAHADSLLRCRGLLVEALRGREEGFVVDGRLVPGRSPRTVLSSVSGTP